jgi:hypothetical protein
MHPSDTPMLRLNDLLLKGNDTVEQISVIP